MGRPSKYDPALITEMCERLSKGEPMAQICRDEHMPSVTTIWTWAQGDEVISESIARARESGEEVLLAQCLDIANTPAEGTEVEEDADGNVVKVKRGDMLGHRKLQIDTRLKLLAKWNPKKWGDRMALAGDNETPLQVNVLKLTDGYKPEPD